VDLWTYAGIAAALVLVSGFFSGTEVALFALRRIDREQMARSGRGADRVVVALLSQPRRLITTVLIGNEVVNGAIAALAVFAVAEALPDANPLACAAIAVAVALPIVVLLGEVTAKTFALKSPLGWARAAGRILYLFHLLVTPLRWIVAGVADLLLKPFGGAARPRGERDLSEEEFRTLVDAGQAEGQVDARERRIIHRVFEFSDKNVGQVMTPREKLVALSYDLPMARLAREVAGRGFSRIPIYQRSLDNVRGILNAKDLVPILAGQPAARTLAELLHEPLFVPRTTPIKRLFRTFKQKKVHMALVVNEYGKVLGLVTMDDLLSQLFGAIRDEREGQQRAALRRGRGGKTPAPVSGVVEEPKPPETTPVPLQEAGDVAPDPGAFDRDRELTPAETDDETPPPVDPAVSQRQLENLAGLEDETTPPPVDTVTLRKEGSQ
jgi:CBS domain containing-hemolysin-like protein